MSRFEEVVNEAIDEVVLGETLRAEELAAQIAEPVRERQDGPARRGDDRRPLPGDGPDPGLGPPHPGDLHAVRHRGRLRARHPHPDRRRGPGDDRLPLRPGAGRRRARASGSPPTASPTTRSSACFEAVPVATHNQRGIGSLHIGRPEGVELDVDARDLLHIVEQSMSSEIYELMKRSDEVAVVEKAHRNPRFVEDCVREMVRRVAERLPAASATAASSSPARRTWRRSTATPWSPSAPACSPRSSPSSRAASTRRHHMTEREWLEAPCAPERASARSASQPPRACAARAPSPAACAARRSSRRRRSRSPRPPRRPARRPRSATGSR